jgi:hypothetical protein
VLEIEVAPAHLLSEPENMQAVQALVECLIPHFPDAQFVNSRLTLRGADLAARLPELLQILEASGGRAGSIHIRVTTLEDVFLSLTGRGLRE